MTRQALKGAAGDAIFLPNVPSQRLIKQRRVSCDSEGAGSRMRGRDVPPAAWP